MATMQIEEPLVDDKIHTIETFVEFESGADFKGSIVLDIDDQLLCSNVQTEAKHMYDEL